MMQRGRLNYLLWTGLTGACCLANLAGCGKSEQKPVAEQATSAQEEVATADAGETPHDEATDLRDATQVVTDFLQAIKAGDETVSNELLTPLARQKTGELNMAVAPMGSETASFTVGEAEMPTEGGGELAHVASTWTDLDDDGQERTDEILWVLRREQEGWRIGGMATKVFEDEPPLLLDFEDPVDMRRKQQLAEAEMERRAKEAVADEPEGRVDDQEEGSGKAVPVADQRQSLSPSRQTKKK